MLAPDSPWELKMLAPDSARGLVQPWSLVQAPAKRFGASIGASIICGKSFNLLVIQGCLHQTPRKYALRHPAGGPEK
jgi:hypothetical protein